MSSYRTALCAYLDQPDRTQAKLADEIGKTQAALSRYTAGLRFPDADTARMIDEATAGAVPFALWQSEAAQRFGLELPAEAA